MSFLARLGHFMPTPMTMTFKQPKKPTARGSHLFTSGAVGIATGHEHEAHAQAVVEDRAEVVGRAHTCALARRDIRP